MKKALLLIDIQNDYFHGGKCELYKSLEAADNAQKILNKFRQNSLPVIHIQHINMMPDATFFVDKTIGILIHDSVFPLSNEQTFIKHKPNSFFDTGLAAYLKANSITDLVVCGMMSHMCIDTTVRACKDFGFNVTLIYDACTTKDLLWHGKIIPAQTVHDTFMAALNGTFSKVISANDYLEQ